MPPELQEYIVVTSGWWGCSHIYNHQSSGAYRMWADPQEVARGGQHKVTPYADQNGKMPYASFPAMNFTPVPVAT